MNNGCKDNIQKRKKNKETRTTHIHNEIEVQTAELISQVSTVATYKNESASTNRERERQGRLNIQKDFQCLFWRSNHKVATISTILGSVSSNDNLKCAGVTTEICSSTIRSQLALSHSA